MSRRRIRVRGAVVLALVAVACALATAEAFAALAPDALEPDDAYTQASTVPVDGTPQSHTLYSLAGSSTADYDWVSFEATAGVTYDMRTQVDGTVNPDTVLTLYDADGSTELAFNDDFAGPFSRIVWTSSATRTVYLQVTDADTYFGSPVPQTGEYAISVALAAPSVAGRVTDDASGAPLSGIRVTAYAEDVVGDWYVVAWTATGAGGTYELDDLFDGAYAIEFSDVTAFDTSYATEYYDDAPDIDAATAVVTTDRETVAGIDAALTQIDSVVGRVTAQPTGAPLEGVSVRAWRYDGGSGAWFQRASAVTLADGTYQLGGLGTGTYRIQFVDTARHEYRTRFFGDGADIEAATDVSTLSGLTVDDIDASLPKTVERVYGRDRFSTAVAIARAAYPGWAGVGDVVVASGDDRAAADPLAACGMCWAYDAPLVLVSATRTPDEVKVAVKEIADANGEVRLHVVGGAVSVPDARVAELVAFVGGGRATSERVLGSGSRYDLAAAIARRMAQVRPGEAASVALIANGADSSKFFDALALSAVSRAQGMPVLLVEAGTVPPATQNALTQLDLQRRIVGGGPNTVSEAVRAHLGAERWSGRNRYDTAVRIAENALAEELLSPGSVAIVSKVPDGLAGGAFVGSRDGALVVTAPSTGPAGPGTPLEEAVVAFLRDGAAHNDRCYVFGGPASVSAEAAADAALALE